MRIVLINGSPKVNQSTSGILLEDLKKQIATKNQERTEIREIGLHDPTVPGDALERDALKEIKNAEVLVISCPLYVDGIPAHLLSCLLQLENADWQNRQITVYGIVNCGFYEGIQAEYALEVLQNWCIKADLVWGGGIGVGGGGALGQMPSVKNGHGPKAPVENALGAMADTIFQRKVQENKYVSVAFPRFLYQMAAQMGWRQMIKANGGKKKDLDNQPE